MSNPPILMKMNMIISTKEIKKFEPKIALIGGKDGLKFYRLFSKRNENK